MVAALMDVEPSRVVGIADFTDGQKVMTEQALTYWVKAVTLGKGDQVPSHPGDPCHPWFLRDWI